MKTKNRLLLSSALLLGLVAVSGTTATYAWFTVGMSQDATVSNITASAGSALKVEFAEGNGAITVAADKVTLGWKESTDLTDITSDVKVEKWYKAKFDSTGENVKSLKEVTDVSAQYSTDIYYAATFSATVSFTDVDAINTSAVYNIYASGSTENGMISGDTDIAAATRVFVNNDSQSKKVIYLGANSSGKVTLDSGDETDNISQAVYDTSIQTVTADDSKKQDGTVENQLVGELNTANNFKINLKFTVFIEGTDSVNAIVAETAKQKAALNFHIYAVEQ